MTEPNHCRSFFQNGSLAPTDKHYNFCLASADPDCAQLAVAESPIDALSLATLVKRGGGDWRDYSYLSLGGTASRALL